MIAVQCDHTAACGACGVGSAVRASWRRKVPTTPWWALNATKHTSRGNTSFVGDEIRCLFVCLFVCLLID